MEKIEKFLGTLIVLFLIFLLVTTFFKVDLARISGACSDDLVTYNYVNKITGEEYVYTGGSTCKPKLLGFFWEEVDK